MDSKKVHHHLLKISWMVFLILMSFSTAQGADRTESLFASPETAMGAADNDFRVFFNNGLNFETRDKMFKYKIGGRIMWDIGTFDADDDIEAVFGEQDPGSEFRRARIYMAGLLWNRVKFKAQYDFAGNVDFKDVYIGLTKIPYIGNFQAGHFKEPFSLEELTSSKYITFMERSLANTFSPGRNAGLAIYNMNLFDNRATAAIGLFQEVGSDPPDRLGDNGYNVTLRVTGAPIMREKGKKLAHVGFSYSYKSPEDDVVRFRSRPEVHLTDDRFVDTRSTVASLTPFVSPTDVPALTASRDSSGDILAEDVHLFGFEAAGVYSSASVQGEFILANVDVWGVGTANLYGFYVEGSYFFTGEHRKYKKGAFARVKPIRNFGKNGFGALQLAVRYSMLDLNDSEALVFGGEEQNVTVGLNWYLNPNTRVMFNYVNANPDQDEKGISLGEMQAFMSRFQIDF